MGAAVNNAVTFAAEISVEIAVENVMASPWASTVFHYLVRHSVEARGIFVESCRRSAEARGVSAVVRASPWTWT